MLALLVAAGAAFAQDLAPAQNSSTVSPNLAKNAQATAKSAAQTASQTNSQNKPQAASQTAKPKTQPQTKTTSPAKPAAAQSKSQGAASSTAPPAKPAARRDPFVTLVGRQNTGGDAAPLHLPPGKAGLQVSTVVLQGIVSTPNGMIAIVANPQKSVYFLHQGDALFDGSVVKIAPEEVTFHEIGKDAFGKPLERDVTKKLHPSSGEQP
jgi:Tfp pilus assembly protein PilP